ncbi:hypothetical protein IWW39_000645 [Coemansia spiralis]|uniref:Uncharacterized protein n=1 Tax=Coemansia spiralis TaxID=417178 RepID=A0A9W8L680_9FUNG|nr:hypothetical protein IWW39_000645 [Coemansia spiralis]
MAQNPEGASSSRRHSRALASPSTGGHPRQQQRTGARETSWLRNNWTESETREVMEILVSEFLANEYCTAAYSKSHAPDARFDGLSFSRPPRELYNKVQNLRQRFFTPHCYLLRWAHPKTDARSLKRAKMCLMNPKTRESIHGIFSSDAPESTSPSTHVSPLQEHPGFMFGGRSLADESNVAVKSVNYYCDIFRRQAPDLWVTSVEAYRKFLACPEMQCMDMPADDSPATGDSPHTKPHTESSSKPKRRRQSANSRSNNGGNIDGCTHRQMLPGQCAEELDYHSFGTFGSLPSSLASSVMLETPSSSLLTDFGSGFNSDANDDGSCDHVFVSLAGHSWHKFLSQRNRWSSLGLNYAGKDDWVRQEAAFLVEHFFTLIDCEYPHSTGPNTEVPLTIVPQFYGSFDAPNIEMAVSRSHTTRIIRLSRFVEDLISCLEFVDNKEQFTVVSLCRLTDRQTRSTTSLALLVSHGSNSQRFGVFPHNDPMLGRLIAGNENLWHEYCTLGGGGVGGLMPMTPKDEPLTQTAFAYAQSGIKYTFFVRLKGHFFEMTRDKDWMPTMVPTQPRPTWSTTGMSKDTLLSVMRHDTEKVLAGMVELYGLRLFCYGFFEAIALPTSNNYTGSTKSPSRRISDDPSMTSSGFNRRNPSQHLSRGRRSRVSAGTIGSSALSGNNSPHSGANNLPYRRPPGQSSSSTSLNQLQQQQQQQQQMQHLQAQSNGGQSLSGRSAQLLGRNPNINHLGESVHAAMPFLSPQARHYNSFPPVDMASMSVSLPNSPFLCFPLDGQQFAPAAGNVAQESWFPSLSDAALAANPASNLSAAANTAAAARASGLLPTDSSLGGLTSIAAAGGMSDDALSINMYPATSAPSHHALSGAVDSLDAAPSMNHTGGGLDASSLFSNVAATGSTSSVLSNSPAFWDISHTNLNHRRHHLHSSLTPAPGSMSVPMGPISDMQSPNLHLGFRSPHSMAGLTGSMTEMSMAAAAIGGMAGRVSVDGGNMHFGGMPGDGGAAAAASVALYPPPHNTPSMLGWDDMAAQSFSGVLNGAHHSTDMLMQLAQPSPTLTHYNVSAQATPAFEAYSTPVLHHQLHHVAPSPFLPSLGGGSAMPADQPFLMHTPVSAPMANLATEADGSSAMAAYFGAAPHRANNSAGSLTSQETLMNSGGVARAPSADGQLSMAKGCMMYSTAAASSSTPALLMDVEFPATSC